MIKSINAKHQKTVSKFIKADRQYSARIDQLHSQDIDDSEDLLASKFYSNVSHYFSMLPAREKANIAKTIDTAGY